MSSDFFNYSCSDQNRDSLVTCSNVPKVHIVPLVTKRLTEGNNHQVYRMVSTIPTQSSPSRFSFFSLEPVGGGGGGGGKSGLKSKIQILYQKFQFSIIWEGVDPDSNPLTKKDETSYQSCLISVEGQIKISSESTVLCITDNLRVETKKKYQEVKIAIHTIHKRHKRLKCNNSVQDGNQLYICRFTSHWY